MSGGERQERTTQIDRRGHGCTLTLISCVPTAMRPAASFFPGVRIRLGMIFNYLILWVRVKGQGYGFG